MKVLKLTIFVFFSTSAFSQSGEYIAEVSMLRGNATKLELGMRNAIKLKKGDKLKEDTSILTGKSSFVQLKYYDNSLTNLGPNSKIVVAKMDKKGNGIINLLKGRIRNIVKKDEVGKKRVYLRTRNAAIAVRGTEFETVYNETNNITSTLTYKGEVAMALTEEVSAKKFSESSQKARKNSRDSKEIEKLMKKNPSVIKKGQFSQTISSLDTVSRAVVISPVQLNAMYKNKTFQTKSHKSFKAAELDPSKNKLALLPDKQSIPPEGVFDPETKAFAQKAGGFIDMNTGIYIPPSSDALFDQKNKVYYSQKTGDIDLETGQYEPPVGLSLDPVKGFVDKPLKKNTPVEFIAYRKERKQMLNEELSLDVLHKKNITKDKIKETSKIRPLSDRELISKNIFSLTYLPFSQDYFHRNDSFIESVPSFRSDANYEVKLGIHYASGSKWQPLTYYSFRNVDFSDEMNMFSQQGEKLTELTFGMRYSLSSRWGLTFFSKLDQQYFLHHAGDTNTVSELVRITIPKFQLELKGNILQIGRLTTNLGAHIGSNLPKTSGDQKLDSGLSYGGNLEFRYFFQKSYISLGIYNNYDVINVEGTTRVYTAETERESNGLGLNYSAFF